MGRPRLECQAAILTQSVARLQCSLRRQTSKPRLDAVKPVPLFLSRVQHLVEPRGLMRRRKGEPYGGGFILMAPSRSDRKKGFRCWTVQN